MPCKKVESDYLLGKHVTLSERKDCDENETSDILRQCKFTLLEGGVWHRDHKKVVKIWHYLSGTVPAYALLPFTHLLRDAQPIGSIFGALHKK